MLNANDTILITGGTGSFGRTMINHILETSDAKVRLFSRDEKKQDHLRKIFNSKRLEFYIGDVRDKSSVNQAVQGVDYIFHAAALKQVPSCEFFPIEAVKTNILGADNLLSSAVSNNVKKVVCLSTDKAVYPINAMGITKAAMEKVALSYAKRSMTTSIMITRYGNVMGSRGSVIPLFWELATQGKDLTVTDPKMTRFLMDLDESVDLVMAAFNKGNNGDLFVQKAPSCTIGQLADAVKQYANSASKIIEIGHRHGEKLHETLLSSEEMSKAHDIEKFYKIPMDTRDLNYGDYHEGPINKKTVQGEYNSSNTTRLSLGEVIDKITPVILKGFYE